VALPHLLLADYMPTHPPLIEFIAIEFIQLVMYERPIIP
jgi:hypothetical protein